MSIPYFIDKNNPPRDGKKTVERNTVQCIVKHWNKDLYLGLRNKKFGFQTYVIGGIDRGEDALTAGRREILEETGFTTPRFVKKLGDIIHSAYFATHKDENRLARVQGLYFELENGEQDDIAPHEMADVEIVWLTKEEMPSFVKGAEVHELWTRLWE
jgi:8-oxo-dGTP pyrophosphatase MutT (NUDIX family)